MTVLTEIPFNVSAPTVSEKEKGQTVGSGTQRVKESQKDNRRTEGLPNVI